MAAVISSSGEEGVTSSSLSQGQSAAITAAAASFTGTSGNKQLSKLPVSSISSEKHQPIKANSTVLSDIFSNKDTINYDSATAAVKGLKIAKVH
jgi:hypothetical protein